MSARTTPNPFTNRLAGSTLSGYRPRHASQLVSLFALSRRRTPGIDVVLGGEMEDVGNTNETRVTCERQGLQLQCWNLNTSVAVLLPSVPVPARAAVPHQ